MLSLSFLHSSNKMSFSSEILQKWEELIYVRLPKISDFFDLIYYFLNFFKKAGAGDPGHQKSALVSQALDFLRFSMLFLHDVLFFR